ncbi:hypothetical protein LSAT2_012187 [Lamellibrachia satsuma]|nr:hypothetical protein LSAT2_012187 [Lamellibrachia satsuma]
MDGNVTSAASDFGVDLVDKTTSSRQGYPLLPFMAAMKLGVGVTGLVGNLLVVIVFIKYKKLFQQVKSVYIINQSFIDCVGSALLIVSLFVRKQTVGPKLRTNDLFCKLWLSEFFMWGLMISSTYNLMAISIERYMAIVHPIWHKVSFTKTKANVLVAIIWLFGVLFVASFVIPTSGVRRGICYISYLWPSRATAKAVGTLQIVVNIVLPILVHCLCYVRILATLRKRATKVTPMDTRGKDTDTSQRTRVSVNGTNLSKTGNLPSTSAASDVKNLPANNMTLRVPNTQRAINEKLKRNTLKTLAIVTACYFICWTPNKVYIILYMMGQITMFGHVYQATVILVFTNTCINPIIYIAKYDAFKTGLTMLLRCRRQNG